MHLLSSPNFLLLHLLLLTSPCPPFIFTPLHSSELTNIHIFKSSILSSSCSATSVSIPAKMERERSQQVSLFTWVLIAGLLSHNLVTPVTSTSVEERKNYYPSPSPHTGTPPSGGSPETPSHGSGCSYGGSPPSHGTPSHGGGHHRTPTPSTPSGGHCGTPHEPSTPSRPSHSPSHGGYYHSPPTSGGGSPPSYDGSPPTPVSYSPPTPPTSGGGCPPSYGGSPPTPVSYNPPTPPTSGGSSPPSYGGSPPTPVSYSPPTTPTIDPGTPSVPTPPFFPAPIPPIGGTCE